MPSSGIAYRSRLPRLVALLLLVALGLPLFGGCARPGASPAAILTEPPVASAGTVLDPPKELADFTLTDHTGEPLSLSDLRGKPVLLFFGYTHCPDVCPLTLTEWKNVKQELGDAADDIAFVFISVDGVRDTPDVLARYVGAYDPAFTGLTGDEAAVRAAASDFGVFFQGHHGEGDTDHGLVNHTTSSFLLNADGRLRIVYSYGIPADVISADIRQLLASS